MPETAFIKRDQFEKHLSTVLDQSGISAVAEEQIKTLLLEWMAKQPEMPRLIASVEAARLFGVAPSGIAKLRDQGRMPEPVAVSGSYGVYLREPVEKLAREIAKERQLREERRAAREAQK